MADMAFLEGRERWVKHYASFHQILLVGEGDFSFALSLARSFGFASNIVATSLDSYDSLIKKYKNVKSNLLQLEMLGASLLHGVDATKMKLHPNLRMRKFDRIIYNFPHAGFLGKEDHHRMIKMHRNLVLGFFHNAAAMLRGDGEVHVSHKTSSPFDRWNLEELALKSSLVLIELADFKVEDYPGYKNKRGHGPRSDEPFPLGECCTFKFIISYAKNRDLRNHQRHSNSRHLPSNHHPKHSISTHPNSYLNMVNGFSSYSGSALDIVPIDPQSGCQLRPQPQPIGLFPFDAYEGSTSSHFEPNLNAFDGFSSHIGGSLDVAPGRETVYDVFHWFLNHVKETNGQPDTNVAHSTHVGLRHGYEQYVRIYGVENSGGFTDLLSELYQLTLQRLAWLGKLLAKGNLICEYFAGSSS